MLTYGNRLPVINPATLLPYMAEEAQRRRDARFDSQRKLNELAMQEERLKRERAKTMAMQDQQKEAKRVSQRGMQDPLALTPAEYMWDLGAGRALTGSKVPTEAINLAVSRGADPNVLRQISAGTLANVGNQAVGMQNAINDAQRIAAGADNRDTMIAQLAGARGYLSDKPEDYGFLQQSMETDATINLAKTKAQGYIDAAKVRNEGKVTPKEKPITAKNLPPDREWNARQNADKEWSSRKPDINNPNTRGGLTYKQILEREYAREAAGAPQTIDLPLLGSLPFGGQQAQPQQPAPPTAPATQPQQPPPQTPITTQDAYGIPTMSNVPSAPGEFPNAKIEAFMSRMTPEQMARFRALPPEEKIKFLLRISGA